MQSPGYNQKLYDRFIDDIKKCGENRGPHDYIPISWSYVEKEKHIGMLMCRVCFQRVHMKDLYQHFGQIMLPNALREVKNV